MPDPRSLYVVKGVLSEDGSIRYWTGKLNGRWPEYLRSRDRAYELSEEGAREMAAHFNRWVEHLNWFAEPAVKRP